MRPFRVYKVKVEPLERANVDTDQIIPKQFLKRIERTGFGEFLFYDWRHTPDGQLDPAFSLNQPRYSGASVLVAGKNFGCGAVIAPSFADIFANNCVKNGVLTVLLSEDQIGELARRAGEVSNYELAIDLEKNTVSDEQGFSAKFQIDEFTRYCLLNGFDDIGLTLQHEGEIAAYEAKHPVSC